MNNAVRGAVSINEMHLSLKRHWKFAVKALLQSMNVSRKPHEDSSIRCWFFLPFRFSGELAHCYLNYPCARIRALSESTPLQNQGFALLTEPFFSTYLPTAHYVFWHPTVSASRESCSIFPWKGQGLEVCRHGDLSCVTGSKSVFLGFTFPRLGSLLD